MFGENINHPLGFNFEENMPKIKNINHIAIVVDELDAALEFWRDVLGLRVESIEDVPEQEARVAFLPSGTSKIELVEPTTSESGIARYLQKFGPGLHHFCIEIEDVAATLELLKEHRVRLINETPQIGADGRIYAFIHPESTKGVLLELYQTSE
jgi:methylmalonyl-CoA/ethylmalonyl-CoA epimerase